MKRTSIAAVAAAAAALIATPAWAVSDATGTTNDEYVEQYNCSPLSMFNDRLAHPGAAHIAHPGAAHAGPKDCAAIRAFNAKAPSMAAMKFLPCHCIPVRERVDKVYAHPPAGFTCGNHVFYDKQCHQGMTCFRDGAR